MPKGHILQPQNIHQADHEEQLDHLAEALSLTKHYVQVLDHPVLLLADQVLVQETFLHVERRRKGQGEEVLLGKGIINVEGFELGEEVEVSVQRGLELEVPEEDVVLLARVDQALEEAA